MQLKNIKSLVIPLLILLLGIVAMGQLAEMREEVPANPPSSQPRVVNVLTVEPTTEQAHIISWGRLRSAQPLVLLSEAEGILLAGDVPFQQGQAFKRGQVLIRIDDRQKALALKRVKSDFINAMAALLPDIRQQYPEQWKIWNRYFQQLQVNKPLPALPPVQVEKIKRLLARHNAYQLYYAARIEQIALAKYQLSAPFNGTVTSAELHAGASVRPGTQLGEILNLEQLDLVLQMSAADLQWLDPEGEVIVRSSQFAGEWHGRIDRIGSHVDETTQTVPVYVRLAEGEQALPTVAGLLFEAQLPGKTIANAVSVPLENLYRGNQVYVLFDGALQLRTVSVARREAKRAIIHGGLTSGDQLVTDLLEGVAPDMPAISVEQFQQRAGAS